MIEKSKCELDEFGELFIDEKNKISFFLFYKNFGVLLWGT